VAFAKANLQSVKAKLNVSLEKGAPVTSTSAGVLAFRSGPGSVGVGHPEGTNHLVRSVLVPA
jgi:hypothetical protein